MARPKKKYIRDLFEKDFNTNFVNYINNIQSTDLKARFIISRLNVCKNLLKGIHFLEYSIFLPDFLNNDGVLTIEIFDKIIFKMEFASLLYQIFEYKELSQNIKNKESLTKKLEKDIAIVINKSLEKYISDEENHLFGPPSNKEVVRNILLKILAHINYSAKKHINPKYKKERKRNDDLKKNNTFLAHEYELITNIYDNLKSLCQGQLINIKNYTKEELEELKYIMFSKFSTDIDDDKLDFVINNISNDKKKKDIAFCYLRMKYNIEKNNETLDKNIDRGRKKRKCRDIGNIDYKKIDLELNKLNQYPFFHKDLFLKEIATSLNVFKLDIKEFQRKHKI